MVERASALGLSPAVKLGMAMAAVLLVLLPAACGDGGDTASEAQLEPAEQHYNRAVDLGEEEERWEDAIAEFDKAIELDPNLALAYSGRGHSYVELGNVEQAIVDYDQAIELDPDLALAYRGRGLAYAELGDVDQGLADLEKALALESDRNARVQLEEIIEELRGP